MWWYQSIKRERRRVKAVCGNTPLAVRDVTPLVRLEVLGLLNKISVLLKTLRLSCLNVEIAVFQTCLACSSQTHPQKETPFKIKNGPTRNFVATLAIFITVRFCTNVMNPFYHSTRYIFTPNEYLYFDRLGSARQNDLTPCITASYIPAVHSSLDLGTR